jgi:uncharacterized RDD family membrane protein YckC
VEAGTSPSRATGRRIGAAFIDLIVFWVLYWGAFLLVADSGPQPYARGNPNLHLALEGPNYHLAGAAASGFWAAGLGAALLWFGVLPGLTGWTPGKLLTGVRVVRPDGSRAGVSRNLVRAALWLVDGFPYIIPGLVGFVLLLANDGRRVADLSAGTYVVAAADAGRPVVPGGAPSQPPPGWYADPSGSGRRWWDGSAWTQHAQQAGPLN